MKPIRIVIADDHAILRAGLRSLLASHEDMEVVAEATDGKKALSATTEHGPDVLLLDLTMPESGGLDVLAKIREASPNTRILVLTMHEDHAYLRSVLKAGGHGYILKRAADAELLTAIREVHQGRSYIDVSLGSAELQRVFHTNSSAPGDDPSLEVLSERELQVLEGVAMGHTHKEIAESLNVSVKTIETYRLRVADKLGLKSRAELVRYALRHGLLKVGEP